LGLTPGELGQLDAQRIMLLQAWQDGKDLALWIASQQNRPRTSPIPNVAPERGGRFRYGP